MPAPILWAPGKNALFLQETCVHKTPRFKGGILGLGGGGADFIFMGAGTFLSFVVTGAVSESRDTMPLRFGPG